MSGKKENSLLISLIEVLPGILLGFSIGCGITTLFCLSWTDRHYPYEKLVFTFIYNVDRMLFVFMTAFVTIKIFGSKQKKQYLKELVPVSLCGGVFGWLAAVFVSFLGNLDLVNSIWGI